MLWNLSVKRIRSKLQFHAGRVVRFGAGAAAGAGPAHSSTPDLFRSRNSSLLRGSLSLSRSLIAAGLVDDRSSSTRRSLAAEAQAPTRATALSGRGRCAPVQWPQKGLSCPTIASGDQTPDLGADKRPLYAACSPPWPHVPAGRGASVGAIEPACALGRPWSSGTVSRGNPH